MRKHIADNTCYISRGMGVRKTETCKQLVMHCNDFPISDVTTLWRYSSVAFK